MTTKMPMTALALCAALAAGLAGALALPVLAQTAPAQTAPAQTAPAQTAPAVAAPAPSLSAIVAGFETRGYRVIEVDVNKVWIEIEAVSPTGQKVEAHVDPVTGATVKEQPDT